MRTSSLILSVLCVACSKSDDAKPEADQSAADIDVAAVNALVSADLKSKLVFEQRDVVLERGRRKQTFTAVAPKGWEQTSKMFASLEPKKDAGLGFFNSLKLGSNCDGSCEPKDWEAVVDKAEFQPFAKGKVLKDDKSKGRRTMIVSGGGTGAVNVIVAWWSDGASRYHSCHATLENDLEAAAPAFEKACQMVAISGDD